MIKRIEEYSATWCMPCKAFAKTLEEFKNDEKYKDIDVKTFDVESDYVIDNGIAEKYSIRSVPTTILFDENDEILKKIIGNVSLDSFKNVIDEYIDGKNN